MTWLTFFVLMLAGLTIYRLLTFKPIKDAISAEFGPSSLDCTVIHPRTVNMECSSVLLNGVLYDNFSLKMTFATSLRADDLYWQEKIATAHVFATLSHKSLIKYWKERLFNRFDIRSLEHLGESNYEIHFRVVKIDEEARGQIILNGDRLIWRSEDPNPVPLLIGRRGVLRFHPLGLHWRLSLLHEDTGLLITASFPE
ncbi:MAG: hypothetical protein V2G42_03535 [bacterium JZ-2024 1]